MSNDYEERARAWYLSDVSDHVSAVESLAALLREVAEEARQALADTLAPRWEEMVCAVEHLSALRAERDRLLADLAAEREWRERLLVELREAYRIVILSPGFDGACIRCVGEGGVPGFTCIWHRAASALGEYRIPDGGDRG